MRHWPFLVTFILLLTARLLAAPGNLDPSFQPLNGGSLGIATQPDGKIVVGGGFPILHEATRYLLRLNADGSEEPGFGPVLDGFVYGVALQADGKILFSGDFTTVGGVPRPYLARLNADGSLDTAFTPVLDRDINCFALQADGKIVIGGGTFGIGTAAPTSLARLNPDGTLDPTLTLHPNFVVDTIAIQPDGRILVSCKDYTSGPPKPNQIIRFNADGTMDPGFAMTADSYINCLAVQPDGRTIIGGWFTTVNATTRQHLARLETDGSLDTSFDPSILGKVASIVLQEDQHILVAGDFYFVSGEAHPNLTRLLPSGAPDSSFAPNLGGPLPDAYSLAVQPDGSVLVGGHFSSVDGASRGGFTRLQNAPARSAVIVPALDKVQWVRAGTAPQAQQVSFELSTDAGQTWSPLGAGTRTNNGWELQGLELPASGEIRARARTGGGYFNSSSGLIEQRSTFPDTTAPSLTEPVDGLTPLLFKVAQGATVALPDYLAQVQTDDPLATLTQNPPAGTLLGEGTWQITLVATDLVGNQRTLVFEVQVQVSGSAALATKGGAVPNDDTDPRIPFGSQWGTFGVPSINMNGTTAGWMATVKASAKVSFQGIFHGAPTAPKLALRTGDGVTDATGAPVSNVTFKSFREPVFSCDEFAVLATVKGTGVKTANDTGIWFGEEGGLREVAREGTVAAGTSVKFKAFTSLAMPSPGVVCFVAALAAPAAKDMGLWVWTPDDGLRLALREGDAVDVGIGDPVVVKSFKALTSVTGSPGHGRYDGNSGVLDVLLTLQDGTIDTAIVAPDASVTAVDQSGEQDIEGHTLATLGVPSSPGPTNSVTRVTLALDTQAGITKANNTGIYDTSENVLRAQSGLPATGAEPAKFKAFLDPVAGLDPLFAPVQAFAATLVGTTAAKDTGIWAYTDATGLKLIAREGSEPEDVPGTKWKTFTSLSVLEGRGVMFTATIASGTTKVKTTNDAGLWATDSTGALKLILRESQEVLPGKFLRSFDVLKSIAGSPGQRRAWTAADPSARIIYRAFFTDGSSAIVSTAVP